MTYNQDLGKFISNPSLAGPLVLTANLSVNGVIASGSIGSNGQFLTSNGTVASWATPSTTLPTGNSGIISNSSGIFVNANNGIVANATGTYVNQGTGTVVNATGVHVNATYINTLIVGNNGIIANSLGIYVRANNGITVNSTGVFVTQGTGVVVNATGTHVNSSYIATIAANSATFLVSAGITANSTALLLANSIAILANGSVGSAGQILSSNGTGIYWASPGAASVNTAAAYSWTNTHTFNSNVFFADQYSVQTVALGSGNNFNINCAAGNYFTLTANGSVANLYFTNTPTNAYACVIKIANGGVNTFNFANTPKWPAASAPTLSTNTDIFVFLSDDGGTTWRGNQSMKDSR